MAVFSVPASAASNNASSRSPGATLTGYVPVVDDLIIVGCNTASATTAFTIPAGWSGLGLATPPSNSGPQTSFLVAHPITAADVTAGTTQYLATNLFNTANTWRACTAALRGLSILIEGVADDINATFNSTASVTHSLPAITGANIHSQSVVIGYVGSTTAGTYTDPAGWTNIVKNAGGVGGSALYYLNARTVAGVDIAATNITFSASAKTCGISAALMEFPSNLFFDMI